ncbi:hypothetical protein GCM10010217_76080 [Streptomyces tubercidicus]
MFLGVFVYLRKYGRVRGESGVFEGYITSLGTVDFIEKKR